MSGDRHDEPARGTRYYRGLPHLAIQRPLGTLAVVAVVLILGLFATGRLPVNLLPNVVYPLIRVSVNYPGTSPEIMEEQVLRVLERQLAQVENLTLLAGDAEEGRANLSLVFNYGVDLDVAMQDTARMLESARALLPPDIDPPRLRKWDPSESAVFQGGFSSAVRSAREVRDWVETRLIPQLQSIPGVSGVEAISGQEREIEVVLDQQRLAAYGLTLRDIADQLGRENRNIAAGNVTSSAFDVLARVDGRFRSAEDVAQVLIPLPDSARSIRLEDVAEVRDGFREQRVFVRLNGVPATQLSVFKQPDANTVQVVDGVNAAMARLEASGFIPDDIQWETTIDAAFFVRGSVQAVASAALLGSVLAMLVVLLFLGSLRKALAIGVSIPVAVLATFSMMGVGGLTLNVMSLGGLALGIGLLLDNAIVMLENIARHRDRLGKEPEAAAHDAADEVASAIVAGTMTNLAAVTPFLLATGFAALVFRELILTITFAVVASLVIALTLVPMAAAQLARVRFRSGLSESRAWKRVDRGVERMADGYEAALRWSLGRRWWVVAASLLCLVGGWLGYSQLGNEFLPQLDNGEVFVIATLPPGTAPEQTDDAARQMENVLRRLPHVDNVFAVVGGQLWGGVVTERAGRVILSVRLSGALDRPDWPAGRWVNEARRQLRALDLPGARIMVRPPQIRGLNFNVAGEEFEIKVVGEDMAVMESAARRIARLIEDVPGLVGVEVAESDRSPQLSVEVDRDRAAALGLNVGEVGTALRDALTGAIPTRFSAGQNEYDVRVRLPRDALDDIDALGSVLIGGGSAGAVRVADVATLGFSEGPSRIQRENQVRIQRVTGSFNTTVRDVGSTVEDVRRRLEAIDEDVGLIFGGQYETIEETNREALIVLLLATFLVFAVLVIQYERLSNPVVIILTAPFSLVGAVIMLWITGTPISSPALLGMILLIGIVVNNAILLIEYIERSLLRGESLVDSVVAAGRIRLRPILMSVLTTVVGMAPLAFGMGAGADMMQPLALVVIGGLLFSTLLTLMLAPCLFIIIRGAANWLGEMLTGRKADDPAARALRDGAG